MFLVDNVLMSPVRGILSVFREIHNAALQEIGNEAGAIRTELAELYMLLEAKSISEEEFDERESTLLDRLDAIENRESLEEERDPSP